jgi:hypothetical protein
MPPCRSDFIRKKSMRIKRMGEGVMRDLTQALAELIFHQIEHRNIWLHLVVRLRSGWAAAKSPMSTFLILLIVVGCIILALVVALALTIHSAGKRKSQRTEQGAGNPSDRTLSGEPATPAEVHEPTTSNRSKPPTAGRP